MNLRTVKKLFHQRLQLDERDLLSFRPEEGVEVSLAFYAEERAESCSIDRGGDQLLYQWGMYDKRTTPLALVTHTQQGGRWGRCDWSSGEAFQLSLIRRFDPAEGDYLWLLGLAFKFRPSAALRRLGEGSRWCHDPGEVEEFHAFIVNSRAFGAVGRSPPDGGAVEFGPQQRGPTPPAAHTDHSRE